MNIKKTLISLVILLLVLSANQNIVAGNVYQWTNEKGSINFSNIPPEGITTVITYKTISDGKIYQWIDEKGGVQLSDVPPTNTTTDEIHEIKFESFGDSSIDPEKYSIVSQLERVSGYNRQLVAERRDKERVKIEQYRIAQEVKIMRMEEQIRTYGYGPRPY